MQEKFNLFDSLIRGIKEATQDIAIHDLKRTSYIHEELPQESLTEADLHDRIRDHTRQ